LLDEPLGLRTVLAAAVIAVAVALIVLGQRERSEPVPAASNLSGMSGRIRRTRTEGAG
jgi:hypothetical protein